MPTALGVYVTEQLDELPPPATRLQLVGLKAPLPLDVKVTAPVGFDFMPESLSVTVAVQVVGLPTAMLVGEQLTLVLVVRGASVNTVCASEPTPLAVK